MIGLDCLHSLCHPRKPNHVFVQAKWPFRAIQVASTPWIKSDGAENQPHEGENPRDEGENRRHEGGNRRFAANFIPVSGIPFS